jgi:phosphatidylserine/phosphatidylglycerophosphate/cardiolipin synthase-like enzyme
MNDWISRSYPIPDQRASQTPEVHLKAARSSRSGNRILDPGRNCWCIAQSERAAVLIDADSYFQHLEQAFIRARRSILIVGWDFDARIRLRPGDEGREAPTLAELLPSLAEENPHLEIRILVWDFSVLFTPGTPFPLLLGANWQEHPRIQMRLDSEHPLNASHHQKIVCIDDALAFSGGIDLTIDRWDTSGHRPEDELRTDPDGSPYRPVHDLQMAVDGEAAQALALLARSRWQTATGEELPVVQPGYDPWPPALLPDFTTAPVAIARTLPAWKGRPEFREAATLTRDALNAARESVYIEAQYFTAGYVGDCLAELLSTENGPEIVILVARSAPGLLERFVMGYNRDRLIRRLMQADRFGRLRVFSPVVRRAAEETDIYIHSKLIIVDDVFVRIGSSNLNNRSIALDTECDLAIEAVKESDRLAIRRLRERLLAEHCGATPEALAQMDAASPIRMIDRLNLGSRYLRPYELEKGTDGPTTPLPGTQLLDPKRPFRLSRLLNGEEERQPK